MRLNSYGTYSLLHNPVYNMWKNYLNSVNKKERKGEGRLGAQFLTQFMSHYPRLISRQILKNPYLPTPLNLSPYPQG